MKLMKMVTKKTLLISENKRLKHILPVYKAELSTLPATLVLTNNRIKPLTHKTPLLNKSQLNIKPLKVKAKPLIMEKDKFLVTEKDVLLDMVKAELLDMEKVVTPATSVKVKILRLSMLKVSRSLNAPRLTKEDVTPPYTMRMLK